MVAALILAMPPGRAAERTEPLELGLLPFASAGTLFKRFAPLREYLEERIGIPVRLKTAPDFATFVSRTGEGRYDVVLTAPHFVLLALDTGRYEVRARYREPLRAVFLMRSADRGLRPGGKGCRTVATPPPSAVITLLGKHQLAREGRGIRPRFRAFDSHNAAVRAVLGGDACAAVVSVNVWHRIRDQESGLRVVARTATIPGLGILLRKDLPPALRDRLTRVLVGMRQDPRGRAALRRMAYPGYRPADAGDFAPVQPFLRQLPEGWRKMRENR